MAQPTPAQRMEHVIRTYIQACNDADAAVIAACFCPEAVHYFHIPSNLVVDRWTSDAESSSLLDSPFLPDVWSYTLSQNNLSNISKLKIYH